MTVLTGAYVKGTAASLAGNDNVFYVVNSTTTGTRIAEWYGAFSNVPNQISSLGVTYSGKNSLTATQTIAIWRWTDNTWVTLRSQSVGTTEVRSQGLSPPGALADYVSGVTGTGELRVRIRSTSAATFKSKGDVLKIKYTHP